MYNLANASIYFYSIQRGTPHVNLRQKRASLFNSQILVVALIGIFGGLKPKMCVHFSKDWRSVADYRGKRDLTEIYPVVPIIHGISPFQVHRIHLETYLQYFPDPCVLPTCPGISRYRITLQNRPQSAQSRNPFSPSTHGPIDS